MLSKVLSLGLSGVNGYEVQTECYIGTGLPAFDLVGLPDASVTAPMSGMAGRIFGYATRVEPWNTNFVSHP